MLSFLKVISGSPFGLIIHSKHIISVYPAFYSSSAKILNVGEIPVLIKMGGVVPPQPYSLTSHEVIVQSGEYVSGKTNIS